MSATTATKRVSGFSEINSTEESFLAFALFFLDPIGFAFACFVCSALITNLRNHRLKDKAAAYCAIIAVSLQMVLYFNDIFLSNDMFIKWDFTHSQYKWATFTDLLSSLCYGFSKLSFYYAFTFHVLSVFNDYSADRKTRNFLKIWMLLIGVAFVILMLVVVIDDSSSNSAKETGLTSPHNLYVTMLASHEGAKVAKYAMSLAILLDIVYFVVLIYLYVKKLKYLQKSQKEANGKYAAIGIKGITLVIASCLVFWLFFICVIVDTPLKWWGAVDISTNTLCLFLMFEVNASAYRSLCHCCHACYGKMLFAGHAEVELVDELNATSMDTTLTTNKS